MTHSTHSLSHKRASARKRKDAEYTFMYDMMINHLHFIPGPCVSVLWTPDRVETMVCWWTIAAEKPFFDWKNNTLL